MEMVQRKIMTHRLEKFMYKIKGACVFNWLSNK